MAIVLEIGTALVGEEHVKEAVEFVHETINEVTGTQNDQPVRQCTGFCVRDKTDEYWLNRGRVVCIRLGFSVLAIRN